MRLPWTSRPRGSSVPVVMPTEPGRTVMARGQEFVIRTVSYSDAGELTFELLRRDEWDRRYRIR